MKKTIIAIMAIAATTANAQQDIPQNAQRLIDAYPDMHLTYSDNKIVFPDGTAITYDDGKKKDFKTLLDYSDIEDMFSMTYDTTAAKPKYLNDCGRSRNEALFRKMYGNSAAEVQKNLVRIDWFGQQLPVTKVNGADKQLQAIYNELKNKPELKKFLLKASSFNCRQVRGANRMSAHSY